MSKGISSTNELVISRRELQNWNNNLVWQGNGNIIINTHPALTLLKTQYQTIASDGRDTKYLPLKDLLKIDNFEIGSPIPNKFETEVDTFGNTLLNTETETWIKTIVTGPSNEIAVITNHYNIVVCDSDRRFVANLDIPVDSSIKDAQAHYMRNKSRIFHCVSWVPDLCLIVGGNECGQLAVFDCKGEYIKTVSIADSSLSVLNVVSSGQLLACTLSDNSIVLHDYAKVKTIGIKEASRFQVSDVRFVDSADSALKNTVLISDTGYIHAYNITENTMSSCSISKLGFDKKYIIQSKSRLCIFSNIGCLQVVLSTDNAISVKEDDCVYDFLQKKLHKYQSIYNSPSYMNVFGCCVSKDGSTLAVLYYPEIIAPKYNTLAHSQFKFSLIPLNDDWEIKPDIYQSGLLWYQIYNVYGKTLPKNYRELLEENTEQQKYDTTLPFEEYLTRYALESNVALKFQCFVEEKKEVTALVKLYCECLYHFAVGKLDCIENQLDIATIKTVSKFLGKPDMFDVSAIDFEMKGGFIEQAFKIESSQTQGDLLTIHSLSGNVWKRCGLTFLPLLTTQVKKCPISDTRIIDVEKDTLNDYGWFTKTILHVLGKTSIYSDVPYV